LSRNSRVPNFKTVSIKLYQIKTNKSDNKSGRETKF
jgi:hypothetical protein